MVKILRSKSLTFPSSYVYDKKTGGFLHRAAIERGYLLGLIEGKLFRPWRIFILKMFQKCSSFSSKPSKTGMFIEIIGSGHKPSFCFSFSNLLIYFDFPFFALEHS